MEVVCHLGAVFPANCLADRLNPTLLTLHPEPEIPTLHPAPCTLHPAPETRGPRLETLEHVSACGRGCEGGDLSWQNPYQQRPLLSAESLSKTAPLSWRGGGMAEGVGRGVRAYISL